jgi:hypothetical protein
LDERWEDYPPDRAADVLELAPEDYEIDEERSALTTQEAPAQAAFGSPGCTVSYLRV